MNMNIQASNALAPEGDLIHVEDSNRRIKIYESLKEVSMEFSVEVFIKNLKNLGHERNCDKLIFYVREDEQDLLLGYNCYFEGIVKGFFQGEDAYIYSHFIDPSRNIFIDREEEEKVKEIVSKDIKKGLSLLPPGYIMRRPTEKDAVKMAKLYDIVFETYPTPMNNPQFIVEMMNNYVYFTIIEYNGQIVSACSADLFPEFNCAEMSDCATLPDHRGQGLLSYQFYHLIGEMVEKKVKTLFSYSRSLSIGMNLINARNGFTYGGCMIQNSNISGRLEDMNIWFRNL